MQNPDGSPSGFSMLLILTFVGDKLGNVLQAAVQYSTEFIQGFGFNVIVGPQAADSLAINATALSKLVGGHFSLCHSFPEPVKSYHIFSLHLDISHYGGYNPKY